MAVNSINTTSSNNYSDKVKTESILPKGSTGSVSGTSDNKISVETYDAGRGTDSPRQDEKTDKKIQDAISQANNKMRQSKTRCEFSYHEKTKRVSIKMIDEVTQEVIKEIPPEETIKMIEKMWELAGLLIDEKR